MYANWIEHKEKKYDKKMEDKKRGGGWMVMVRHSRGHKSHHTQD